MAENHKYNQDFLKSLSDLVLANISKEGFGALELAKAAGLSQRKMGHRLNILTKKSVSQFICEIRLEKARELLQKEDLTVAEVAYKVGFGSPAYFNKCFSSFFGYPPGQIKKEEFRIPEKHKSILTDPAPSSVIKISRLFIYLTGILITIILLYVILRNVLPVDSSESLISFKSKIQKNSIAVLPFRNLGDNNSNQYFVDGLQDEIISDLSNISDLRVVSRLSVEDFRDSKQTSGEIAKRLHVRYLVTGYAQKYEHSYILRIQLTDAENDRSVWAESFNNEIRTANDIFGMQSHIAQIIASKLKLTIRPDEKLRIEKNATGNLNAYLYYLKGMEELSQSRYPDYQPEHVNKAFNLFHISLQNDSTFSLAYIGLSKVYWTWWIRDMTFTDYDIKAKYIDSAMILSNIALSYNPVLDEAYTIRSATHYSRGNIVKALEEIDKAYKLNPNAWNANFMIGLYYYNLNSIKSIEMFQKAAVLASGYELEHTLYNLADLYFNRGFPELSNYYQSEALNIGGDSLRYQYISTLKLASQTDFKKSIDNHLKLKFQYDPDTWPIGNLGICYLFQGNDNEAMNYFLQYLSKTDSSRLICHDLYPYIGYAYRQNGRKELAEKYFKRAIEVNRERVSASFSTNNYELAAVYAYLGDREKAYEYLRLFGKRAFFDISDLTCLKNDPLFRNIRTEPRFQEFVRNAEASYHAEHERVRKWLEAHKRF